MNESTDRDQVIASLETLAVERLTPCLSLILEETADYLFSLSTSSRLDQKNQDHSYSAFVTLETSFWELAAQDEPWATVLPQIIADVHHILGHTVTVRDPETTAKIEATGIDFIERESDVSLSISEFLASIEP